MYWQTSRNDYCIALTVQVAAQVADALNAAHNKNVVHIPVREPGPAKLIVVENWESEEN